MLSGCLVIATISTYKLEPLLPIRCRPGPARGPGTADSPEAITTKKHKEQPDTINCVVTQKHGELHILISPFLVQFLLRKCITPTQEENR